MEHDNKREQDQRRKSEEERLRERLADRREWLQPREIFSTGSDMPPEVLKLLPKWSKEVDWIREIYQCNAEIEYAYIDFVFGGLVYRLRPGVVSATYDSSISLPNRYRRICGRRAVRIHGIAGL